MKPFSKIMVMLTLDERNGLYADTEISDYMSEWEFDDTMKPELNLHPEANRRAMYALAGELAAAGYDVSVEPVGAPEPKYHSVVCRLPKELGVVARKQWVSNLRPVWDRVCQKLGLEYIG